MSALEIAKFSIPTEKRMAFAFGLFELSVAPLRRKDMFDVIEQEIGKSTPPLGPPKLLPNSDYPVAMIFERDYRPSKSLNKATLMFARFMPPNCKLI